MLKMTEYQPTFVSLQPIHGLVEQVPAASHGLVDVIEDGCHALCGVILKMDTDAGGTQWKQALLYMWMDRTLAAKVGDEFGRVINTVGFSIIHG